MRNEEMPLPPPPQLLAQEPPAATDERPCPKQFDLLRKEYNAITRLSKQFDEFNCVYDPECELPQLADHVHGIIGGLCERLATANKLIGDARVALEKIVETTGCDRGVIYLSNDGPTHYDAEAKCQVYDHENFSPLGDALIALHDMLGEKTSPLPTSPPVATGSAVGKELPDDSGAWFRKGQLWIVLNFNGEWLAHHVDESHVSAPLPIDRLPRGHWFPALPDFSAAEEQSQ